jgi:LysM repeat protein
MVTALRVTWLLELFFIAGCASSGPTIKDYQVMTQALQIDARHAQQTITDLETERRTFQRDLGEARAAKARQEGDLLNAERRLLEVRHIVELQREELSQATAERQRLIHNAREEQLLLQAQLQSQLTEISRLNQQVEEAQTERARLETMDDFIARQDNEMAELKAAVRESLRAAVLNSAEDNAPAFRPSGLVAAVGVYGPAPLIKTIKVRYGDTLWKLARHYGVTLKDLKAANQLETDLIKSGQKLRLPDPTP